MRPPVAGLPDQDKVGLDSWTERALGSRVHTRWRRVAIIILLCVVAATVGWSTRHLDVLPALAAALGAAAISFLVGRRVFWSDERWQRHIASRRRAARQWLEAEARQRDGVARP